MARRRQRLFAPGAGFAVSHGQITVPTTTYRAALKLAVRHARRFDDVVHVVAKDKRRGGGRSILATCIPERRAGKRTVVKCHVKKRKPKR